MRRRPPQLEPASDRASAPFTKARSRSVSVTMPIEVPAVHARAARRSVCSSMSWAASRAVAVGSDGDHATVVMTLPTVSRVRR